MLVSIFSGILFRIRLAFDEFICTLVIVGVRAQTQECNQFVMAFQVSSRMSKNSYNFQWILVGMPYFSSV